VFAGQRDDPFFVDLGSVFDLLGLRPFNPAHLIPLPGAPGVDGLKGVNVHTIAPSGAEACADARRERGQRSEEHELHHRRLFDDPAPASAFIDDDDQDEFGGFVQVSRLGMPLVNEVVIPVGQKDRFNGSDPEQDGHSPRSCRIEPSASFRSSIPGSKCRRPLAATWSHLPDRHPGREPADGRSSFRDDPAEHGLCAVGVAESARPARRPE
jgi:hypothetical protein